MLPRVSASNIILIIGVLLAFNTNIYAQTKKTFPEIDKAILSAFDQLEKKTFNKHETFCPINPNWTTEEAINQALQYNVNGSWKCCEQILSALAAPKNKLNAIEKLHLQIAQADYLSSHQSFDSAKILAIIISQEAGKMGLLSEKTKALLILTAGALKRRNISSAYAWADSAIQLSRKNNNKLLEGKALLLMALCVRRNFTSSTHRAFPYYLQAIDAGESISDSLTLFGSNLYFADDHFEIGQWQEGLPYFNRAIEIAAKSNNVYQCYTAYIGTGYPLMEQHHYQEAIILYKRALALSQQQKLPYNISHCYTELAGAFQQIKQNDSAILYASMAANVPGVDSLWSNTWQLKAAIFKDLGNYKMAAETYAKAMDWANEDFLYRNQDQFSGYEAKLKTAEKELQVVQEKKHSIQLEWMIGATAMLLVMAAWAYLIQRRARHKLVTQNAIIKKQQHDLEKSLSEKEMLLKEIHHRVKNNLSVISSLLELQSSGIHDEKAKAAIAEGQNRVSSIALIHQKLYQHENLAAIEFGGFVKDMIPQVSSVFKRPGQKIRTNIQVSDILIDIDTAVPLGLLINELLTNSFKYAFSLDKEGLISIQLVAQAPGNYFLTYIDNGPGMPIGFDLKESRSLGLRLIYRLSNQIGGSAEYTCNDGCMFIVKFKDAITRNKEA